MARFCSVLMFVASLVFPIQASYFGSWQFVPLQGQPHDVVYDPATALAYVSNRSMGRIDVISVASAQYESSIAVGEMPTGLTLKTDGTRLYTTLHTISKMAEVDLATKAVLRTINLPEGVWWGQPLRVDFDALGHCYWRDGGDGNPYGYLYSLNLETGQSTQLLSTMGPLRYALTHDKNRMLVVTTGSGPGVTVLDGQTLTAPNPTALPDFCVDFWCWPVEGITNNQVDRILVTKSATETHIFDGDFQRIGIVDVGMGWGTFGPWSDMALIVEAEGGTPLNRISFLDTNAVAVLETLVLPEAIGIGNAYDYGSKPIDLSPDGKTLLAVGQTGLYIIPIQTIPQTPPISLEITGPDEMFENTSAQYRAIAHYEDGSTRDVSATASWGTTPSGVGAIQSGLLSAGDLDQTTRVTVWARYQADGVDLQGQKGITIFRICPSGSALVFTGNQYAVMSASGPGGGSPRTICAWAKTSSKSAQYILSYGGPDMWVCASTFRFGLSAYGGCEGVTLDISCAAVTYSATVADGKWHHYALVVPDKPNAAIGDVRLYQDGKLLTNRCATHTLDRVLATGNTAPINLGRFVYWDSERFNGHIDEVCIFQRELLPNDIQSLMHAKLDGMETGLVAYWNFDEGQGQSIGDLSSSANHGTLGSNPTQQDNRDPAWIESDAPVGICDDEEPQWENTYHVDAIYGNDDNNGLTPKRAFATIQKAVDVAEESWTVLVWPGTYYEEVDLKGKSLLLQGQPGAVIDSQGGFGLVFASGEQADTVISNFILANNYAAAFCAGSSPTLRNLTIVGNRNGITAYTGSAPAISNCILWDNLQNDLIGCAVVYSCIQDGAAGQGNISSDPLFADPATGDVHVKSRIGRYLTSTQQWVQDDQTSPCIDAGDPADDPTGEPLPSGGRINMGAYGNTPEASQSPNPWPNAADLTHDGSVDLADLAVIAEQWLWKALWK